MVKMVSLYCSQKNTKCTYPIVNILPRPEVLTSFSIAMSTSGLHIEGRRKTNLLTGACQPRALFQNGK